MDCTLKIISGPENGQEFTCPGGESFIGRSPRCAVRLSSASVSFEHAVITRAGDEYYIENLSANGTFINGDRITAKNRLRMKDQIRLGQETTARVTALPAAAGANSTRQTLLIIFLVMMALGVAVLIIDPFGDVAATDLSSAYNPLQEFVLSQAATHGLPAETPALFSEAWRLESAGDRAKAGPAWVRLHVLLCGKEDKYNVQRTSEDHHQALTHLLKRQANDVPSEDELRAALLQFVVQMERRK